ncbi:hypothetical protein B6U71_02880 [Euryarchaeota archaeon ex4484_178]|nr:MAG: hypothetical protein B6U71_02880 [Euryarchaeota archaeon ex4484_178]
MEVLVVDDSALIVRLIEDMLKRKGVVVETAYTAEEALKKIEKKIYSVYLIDYELPELNGLELARRIKEINKNGKIIIITTNLDFKTSEFLVIYKPFNLDDFYTQVFE